MNKLVMKLFAAILLAWRKSFKFSFQMKVFTQCCGLHVMRLRTWDFPGWMVQFDKSEFWKLKFSKNLKNYFIWEDYYARVNISSFLPHMVSEPLKETNGTYRPGQSNAKWASISCSGKSFEQQLYFFVFALGLRITFSYHIFQDTHFQEFWPVWKHILFLVW